MLGFVIYPRASLETLCIGIRYSTYAKLYETTLEHQGTTDALMTKTNMPDKKPSQTQGQPTEYPLVAKWPNRWRC